VGCFLSVGRRLVLCSEHTRVERALFTVFFFLLPPFRREAVGDVTCVNEKHLFQPSRHRPPPSLRLLFGTIRPVSSSAPPLRSSHFKVYGKTGILFAHTLTYIYIYTERKVQTQVGRKRLPPPPPFTAMNVAPVYRAVLKNLQRACTTRPHFVQDVRFLLSLPLITHHEKHTVVPGATTATSAAHGAEIGASIVVEGSKHPGFLERTTVENYLHRPFSMCYPIDPTTLFRLCYADLQKAIHQPLNADGGVNPVAQQILRYRNLLWLRNRLARVLSEKTTTQLATSLSIADGPDGDDFIPDAFFDPHDANQQGGGSAYPTSASRNGHVGVASDTFGGSDNGSSGEMSTSTLSASSAASSQSGGVRPGAIVSAAMDEHDPDVVYSAGAVGLQREMFVLRHREAFPMAAQFLSGFSTVPTAELAGCAHQQAALLRLVRDKYPTTVTCEDGRVSLSVAVEPFDPQYRTREHAGMGYFATAHRQFRVQFSLHPLALDADDGGKGEGGLAERIEVLVVNSYFVRLDIEAMQIVEEVGYLHSRDVLRMLRERDYGDHFSDYIGSAVTDALGEGEEHRMNKSSSSSSRSSTVGGATASGVEKHAKDTVSSTPAPVPTPSDNARVFSLYFVNPTDALMVLKGVLFYKLGLRCQLANAPIQCIPFGFVVLEA
jgi:hypothetical protein